MDIGVSHLTRGAWIEICYQFGESDTARGRTSHEVRGLKYDRLKQSAGIMPVAPHTRCVD